MSPSIGFEGVLGSEQTSGELCFQAIEKLLNGVHYILVKWLILGLLGLVKVLGFV